MSIVMQALVHLLPLALRRLLAGAVWVMLAGATQAAQVRQEVVRQEVRDPYFGDTLFQFFQARYFTAVTGLMASQHFDRVSHHADEAETLRGGLLLSYGLHQEAADIFTRVLARATLPAVRDRAWFYLGKIRHQRGLPAEAEAALNQIQGRLPPEFEEERQLLRAHLMMARGDDAGAARVLGSMTLGFTPAARYARYNLGVALMRSGDTALGTVWLDGLGRDTAPDEETRSLRDQANIALGFAALQASKPELARAYLERVRLNGMHANKALLGFGWAAAAMKNPKLALVPWLELSQREASDAAVLEARIAVPYAYAELGADAQALSRYHDAIAAFEREHLALDQSIEALRKGAWLDELVEPHSHIEMGWFWRMNKLPSSLPHASHLMAALSSHEFQEGLKNYRDLAFLSQNLAQGTDKISAFGDMLANRRQAFAERLPRVRAQVDTVALQALKQRKEVVEHELAQAELAMDGKALADPTQSDLQVRLERVRGILSRLPAELTHEPEFERARDRARLAAGALTWQLARAYPAQLRQAKKGLQTIDTQLQQAQRRNAALLDAERDEPARFELHAQRMAALERRIQDLIPRVAALHREQQLEIQDLAIAELRQQKQRLNVYTNQARLAMAQLYDRAQQPKEGSHAQQP